MFKLFVLCSEVFRGARNAKDTMKMSALSHPKEDCHRALHIATLGVHGCWYGICVIEHHKPFTPNQTFLC